MVSYNPPYPIVSGVVDGAITAAGAFAGASVAIGITSQDPNLYKKTAGILVIAIAVVILLSILQKNFLRNNRIECHFIWRRLN
jgi:hypothetical protein